VESIILSKSVFDNAKIIAITPSTTENALAMISSNSGDVILKDLKKSVSSIAEELILESAVDIIIAIKPTTVSPFIPE
jgi:hypothetical protein